MRGKILLVLIILIVILAGFVLFSSKNAKSDDSALSTEKINFNVHELFDEFEDTEKTEAHTPTWQEAFMSLLNEYEANLTESDMLCFLLFDFNKSGVPELVIAGLSKGDVYEAVYAFEDNEIVRIKCGEGVSLADTVLSARSEMTVAAGGMTGLAHYYIGPSAGSFGTSTWHRLIMLVDGRLEVVKRGAAVVDVDALSELFDDFGRNADLEELGVAVSEHTIFYIDDVVVAEREFYAVFGSAELVQVFLVDERNAYDVIFGWGGDCIEGIVR